MAQADAGDLYCWCRTLPLAADPSCDLMRTDIEELCEHLAGTVRGFISGSEAMERGSKLKNLAVEYGYTDAEVGIRGSAVTGVSSKTGDPFGWDPPNLSDVDFFVYGESFDKAIEKAAKFDPLVVTDGRVKADNLPKIDPGLADAFETFAKETRKQIGRDADATILTTDLVDELSPDEWIKLR